MKTSTWSLIAVAPLAAAAALVTAASAPVSACPAAPVPDPRAAAQASPASFRLAVSVYDGRGSYNEAPPSHVALPALGSPSITSGSCI